MELVAAVLLLVLAQALDPELPPYRVHASIKCGLSSVGSDTLLYLVSMWSEKLQELHPGLLIRSEGQGSTTAVPALLEGRSQLGPMNRAFKASELEAFEKSKGYRPTAVRVAVDALGVFVNKENPLEEITLEQLDAVWGKERRRGHADIRRWGDLRLEGDWAGKAIVLSGRNSASGTYGFFRDRALLNGDFKDEVRETPSGSPIMTVAVDPHAMAHSGAFYATKAVKALRLAPKARGEGRRGDARERAGGALSALALSSHRGGQATRQALAACRPGVPPLRSLERRPGDRGQGRLLSAVGEARGGGKEESRMIQLLILLAQADPLLPDYKPDVKLQGSLSSIGSDAVNNLMTYWAEAFKTAHPDVQIQIEGQG
jgi:phosphate transport system substrate-binding protein